MITTCRCFLHWPSPYLLKFTDITQNKVNFRPNSRLRVRQLFNILLIQSLLLQSQGSGFPSQFGMKKTDLAQNDKSFLENSKGPSC